MVRQLIGIEVLVGSADAGMKLPPAAVRKSLVCGVADERMSEAEAAGRVRVTLDELGQAIPRLRARRHRRIVYCENSTHELAAEGAPHHRRVTEERAIRRPEL